MSALVLALVLASDAGVPVDGGIRVFEDPIYSVCPEAPPVIPLDGGWTLTPPERNARLACGLVTCETDRRLKGEQLQAAPPPGWLVGSSVVVVLVATVTFFVGRATAPKQ